MALDFPNTPSVGQVYTSGPLAWTWDGTKWTAGPGAGGAAYLPLVGGTLYNPGVNDPLTIRADSPNAARIQFLHPLRTYFAGANSVGQFVIRDQTGGNLAMFYDPATGWQMNYLLTLSGPPTAALHAATKAYVDANIGSGGGGAGYLPLTGGTITGNLGIGTAPTQGGNRFLVANSSDSIQIAIISGVSKALRFGTTTTESRIEGTDQTGVSTYQPLQIGGSTLAFHTGGTVRATINAAGLTTLNGALSVAGAMTSTGNTTRAGISGATTGNQFNIQWTGAAAILWIDTVNQGALALQSSLANYLPLTGGTVTGNIQAVQLQASTVNGSLSFFDRHNSAQNWVWYADGGWGRLYNNVVGDCLAVRADNGWIGLGTGFSANKPVEIYRPGTNDPLRIRTDNALYCRISFFNTNLREWTAGVTNTGWFVIADESGATFRMTIDLSGNMALIGGGSYWCNGYRALYADGNYIQLFGPAGNIRQYIGNGTTYHRNEAHRIENTSGSVNFAVFDGNGLTTNYGSLNINSGALNINSNGSLYMPGGGSIFLNNNCWYYIKDSGGNNQPVLGLSSDSNVYVALNGQTTQFNGPTAFNNHQYSLGNGSFYSGLSGNAWAASYAFAFNNPSDHRYKTDIQDLPDNCLALVSAISPKRFRWREGITILPDKVHWGFIAQEVGGAFREADLDFGGHYIGDDDEHHEALDTSELVAVLWRSVQELTERLHKLEGRQS